MTKDIDGKLHCDGRIWEDDEYEIPCWRSPEYEADSDNGDKVNFCEVCASFMLSPIIKLSSKNEKGPDQSGPFCDIEEFRKKLFDVLRLPKRLLK